MVDLRHPDAAVLARMHETLELEFARIARDSGLTLDLKQIWYSPPVTFDPACVAAVKAAAERFDLSSQVMVSGAGHDAVYLSRVAPTAMIFVPCKDGISHNEIEDAEPDDLAAGCAVLYAAMLERANAPAPAPAG
jgi:N-carbamoyl-L-amino-acid hydrolase